MREFNLRAYQKTKQSPEKTGNLQLSDLEEISERTVTLMTFSETVVLVNLVLPTRHAIELAIEVNGR